MDYAAIKKNQKPDFFLQAYDVIEVPEGVNVFGATTRADVGRRRIRSLGSMFTTGGTSLASRVIY
mgnify:CR=1 FL=1